MERTRLGARWPLIVSMLLSAGGLCQHDPDSPTYDELLPHWGARLKTMSKTSGDFCLRDLQGKLFGPVNPVIAHN